MRCSSAVTAAYSRSCNKSKEWSYLKQIRIKKSMKNYPWSRELSRRSQAYCRSMLFFSSAQLTYETVPKGRDIAKRRKLLIKWTAPILYSGKLSSIWSQTKKSNDLLFFELVDKTLWRHGGMRHKKNSKEDWRQEVCLQNVKKVIE